MNQPKILTVAQAIWLICFAVGFLFLTPADINLVQGLPIRVNAFSMTHTVGYLALFLVNHYLVIRGQAKSIDLALLAGATFVYMFASIWFAQDPVKFLGWLFVVALIITLEWHFPDWPKRLLAKIRALLAK